MLQQLAKSRPVSAASGVDTALAPTRDRPNVRTVVIPRTLSVSARWRSKNAPPKGRRRTERIADERCHGVDAAVIDFVAKADEIRLRSAAPPATGRTPPSPTSPGYTAPARPHIQSTSVARALTRAISRSFWFAFVAYSSRPHKPLLSRLDSASIWSQGVRQADEHAAAGAARDRRDQKHSRGGVANRNSHALRPAPATVFASVILRQRFPNSSQYFRGVVDQCQPAERSQSLRRQRPRNAIQPFAIEPVQQGPRSLSIVFGERRVQQSFRHFEGAGFGLPAY